MCQNNTKNTFLFEIFIYLHENRSRNVHLLLRIRCTLLPHNDVYIGVTHLCIMCRVTIFSTSNVMSVKLVGRICFIFTFYLKWHHKMFDLYFVAFFNIFINFHKAVINPFRYCDTPPLFNLLHICYDYYVFLNRHKS